MGLIAMDAFCRNTSTGEVIRKTLNTMLCASEDKYLVELRLTEHFYKLLKLFACVHTNNVLINGRSSVAGFNRNANWIIKKGTDELLNITRECRREEERVTLCRHLAKDETHVGD